MPNARKTAAVLVTVALLTAACGRLNDDGPGSGEDQIRHPTEADVLVLRIDAGGGFVPIEYNLSAVPAVSIYGDGRMIVTGPVIEIYPGPALPNLQVTQLSEDALQAILAAARDARLMDGDATYDLPCVTDLPTTTFTVVAEGRTNVVSAYALGFDESAGACEGVDTAARSALAAFQGAFGDLKGLVPEGSIGPEEPYVPAEMRVFVLPYHGEPDLPQQPVEWPVAGSLGTFGEPIDVPEGARCGVVSGEDLSGVLGVAATANQLTPWTSDGVQHQLIFRPLLPDEHGC
jgi:hypothetical protein